MSRRIEAAPEALALSVDEPENVVAYFRHFGWELRSSRQVGFEAQSGTWWLWSRDDELCFDWYGFPELNDLVTAWNRYGPVHLHWSFVRQTIQRVYQQGTQDVRAEVHKWVETGGRYPPVILGAVSGWKRPENWLNEVVALAPPRFFLRPAFGEVDAIRQELRDFIVMFERSQLMESLPQARGCSQLARRL